MAGASSEDIKSNLQARDPERVPSSLFAVPAEETRSASTEPIGLTPALIRFKATHKKIKVAYKNVSKCKLQRIDYPSLSKPRLSAWIG